MVSRLASHKGFDLVRRVADELLDTENVQFVLLGTGESELEDFFSGLSERHRGKCGVMLAYDGRLAKQIYAGADIFLMPSKSRAVRSLADDSVPLRSRAGRQGGRRAL